MTVSSSAPSRASWSEANGRFNWWMLLPAAPWLWFLIRSLHPVMDYLAIALPVLILLGVIGFAIGGFVGRNRVASLTAVSLVALFLVAVIAPMRPTDAAEPRDTVRIATMNLGLYWFSDNDAGFFVFEEEPDVLVGMELSESHHTEFESRFSFNEADILPLEQQQANDEALEPEGDTFRRNGLPSVGVYSNYPITVLDDPIEDTIDGGLPGFRVRIDAPAGPMVLYALHIPRPFPGNGPYELSVSEHVEMVEAIAAAVAEESDPVIVAGDLNSIDRGQSYRALTAELNDGMRQSGWAVPTADRPLPWSLLFARLDHILVSDSLCTANGASRDTRYADHRPLVADVGPCAT